MHCCVSFCSIVALAVAQRANGNASLEEVLSNTVVVRAHVVAVEGNDRASKSTQRIDHVFCGVVPQGMTEFGDWSQSDHSIGDPVWPALKLGEEGIWLLRPSRDGKALVRKGYGTLGVQWPVRPSVEARHKEVQKLAEALEEVWHCSTAKEQLERLKVLVHSEVPEVSMGAVMLLADGAPDELKKVVRDLDWSSTAVRAQTTLDEIMFKVDAKEWRDSEQRRALLIKWESLPKDETQARTILSRLDKTAQRKQIEPATLWRILRVPVESDEYPEAVRAFAVGVTRWVLNDRSLGEEVVRSLLKTFDEPSNQSIKLAAAQTVQSVTKVSPEHLAQLIVLRDRFASSVDDTDHRAEQIALALSETVRSLTTTPPEKGSK